MLHLLGGREGRGEEISISIFCSSVMSSLTFIDLSNHIFISTWCHRHLLYARVQNCVTYCFAQFIVSSLAIGSDFNWLLCSFNISPHGG